MTQTDRGLAGRGRGICRFGRLLPWFPAGRSFSAAVGRDWHLKSGRLRGPGGGHGTAVAPWSLSGVYGSMDEQTGLEHRHFKTVSLKI